MKKFLVFCILVFSVASAQATPVELGGESKTVQVGKQILITADLKNNQDIEQNFAYILEIQNQDGVTIYLAWLTGTLGPAQSFSPAISWTPQEAGLYDATIYVWESIQNPTALSPPLSIKINASEQV